MPATTPFKIRSRSGLLSAVLAGTLVSQVNVPSAEALAVPANDLFSHAKRISVGFAATVDTRAATTDDTDAAANAECGAPATAASIWYQITPSADKTIVLGSTGSSYSVGFIVVTGTPDAFALQACGPRSQRFVARAGTVYNILVFDDQLDGTGNGGSLHFATKLGPPPATLSATINPYGFLQKRTHAVTVSGTFTCAHAAVLFLRVDLSQLAGRVTVKGTRQIFRRARSLCDGTVHKWSLLVSGNGRYAGGKATVHLRAEVCSSVNCASVNMRTLIHIRG